MPCEQDYSEKEALESGRRVDINACLHLVDRAVEAERRKASQHAGNQVRTSCAVASAHVVVVVVVFSFVDRHRQPSTESLESSSHALPLDCPARGLSLSSTPSSSRNSPITRESLTSTSTDKVILMTGAEQSSVVQPLLTDLYQISMAYAYWKSNKHQEMATFDLYFRKNRRSSLPQEKKNNFPFY